MMLGHPFFVGFKLDSRQCRQIWPHVNLAVLFVSDPKVQEDTSGIDIGLRWCFFVARLLIPSSGSSGTDPCEQVV